MDSEWKPHLSNVQACHSKTYLYTGCFRWLPAYFILWAKRCGQEDFDLGSAPRSIWSKCGQGETSHLASRCISFHFGIMPKFTHLHLLHFIKPCCWLAWGFSLARTKASNCCWPQYVSICAGKSGDKAMENTGEICSILSLLLCSLNMQQQNVWSLPAILQKHWPGVSCAVAIKDAWGRADFGIKQSSCGDES